MVVAPPVRETIHVDAQVRLKIDLLPQHADLHHESGTGAGENSLVIEPGNDAEYRLPFDE